MITKCEIQEVINEIIEYIGNDYKKTPYLYANLVKYGICNPKVVSWMDREEGGDILGAYLLYYDCLHFYTRNSDSYDYDKFFKMINELNPKVVMVQGGFGNRIEGLLSDQYQVEKNHVFDMDGVNPRDCTYRSELAMECDVESVADLLLSDSEYCDVYERDVLIQQLRERHKDGFGRMVVIKEDNKVVATCSTYGEVDGFAIVGGGMVHKNYRRRGMAMDVEKYICSLLRKENVSRVVFVNFENVPSLFLHEKLGCVKISSLYKFVRKIG